MVRKNWVPEAERSRGYTASFPVSHQGWRTMAIRFTPARAGTVTLSLMGPWEEASPGVLYRQEIIWDDIRVEGRGFERRGFRIQAGRDRLARLERRRRGCHSDARHPRG